MTLPTYYARVLIQVTECKNSDSVQTRRKRRKGDTVMAFSGEGGGRGGPPPSLTGFLRVFGNLSDPNEIEENQVRTMLHCKSSTCYFQIAFKKFEASLQRLISKKASN